MTIIIPMAGLSSRFAKAGFTLPKYMLYIRNRSLFNLAVTSFESYFKTCNFLFVARELYDTKTFIEKECDLLGIRNREVIILNHPTRGQSETVLEGIRQAKIDDEEPILIFNIDTFRPGFTFPESIHQWDGYLEVFIGSGANWSYAETENTSSTRVIRTAEKQEISQFCSTGIYYFRSVASFINAYKNNINSPNALKELYVAPLYNYLIKSGQDIHIHTINRNEVIFCGTPDEYEKCLVREFS